MLARHRKFGLAGLPTVGELATVERVAQHEADSRVQPGFATARVAAQPAGNLRQGQPLHVPARQVVEESAPGRVEHVAHRDAVGGGMHGRVARRHGPTMDEALLHPRAHTHFGALADVVQLHAADRGLQKQQLAVERLAHQLHRDAGVFDQVVHQHCRVHAAVQPVLFPGDDQVKLTGAPVGQHALEIRPVHPRAGRLDQAPAHLIALDVRVHTDNGMSVDMRVFLGFAELNFWGNALALAFGRNPTINRRALGAAGGFVPVLLGHLETSL